MAIRKVAVLGNPVLRQVASPVPKSEITSKMIQELIRDMAETMAEYDGRGLAAPQIHESLQVAIILWDFNKNPKPFLRALINPQIQITTTETSPYWEGCLSLPGLRGKVWRPNKITVKAFDENAREVSFVAEGFPATVIQHECDHLLGKLYIDRMNDLSFLTFDREWTKYFKEEAST